MLKDNNINEKTSTIKGNKAKLDALPPDIRKAYNSYNGKRGNLMKF